MKRWRNCAVILLALFALSGIALAQRDLGTITGTITDPSGSAVPSAKLTLTEDATGVKYEFATNDTGTYTRPALKAGIYSVVVEAAGFQKASQRDILINPGAPTAVNITLQVGNATQTVEVTAAAPLLQTETPVIGADLNTQQVTELPLGGQRTFTYLARLSPGVLQAEPGARDSQNGGFSANGVRSTGENNFLLNGVDNNVNVIDFINQTSFVIGPSVEAIGEMQVLTNGYNAEYGRAAGGVVNINLKSGTNTVHGTLFEILQNTDLNANRWDNNFNGVPRSVLNQNQFGAAIGGPIVKNKLFIFGDYQGTRIKSSGGSINNLGYGGFYTIPTTAMVNGDFSQMLNKGAGGAGSNQLYDPRSTTCTAAGACTNTPFVNNQIPKSLMDKAASNIAALFPGTSSIGTGGDGRPQNNYYVVTPGSLNTDQGDGRVDYHLNDKNSIFGSISWSNTAKTSAPPYANALDGGDFRGSNEVDLGRNAMLSYTRIWSPTIISESRIAFSRLVTSRTQANANTDEFKALGIGGLDPTTTNNGGLPQFGLGRYSQIGANNWLPTTEYNNVWDFIQNVAVNKGTHAMKFGVEFRPIQFPFFQIPQPHGELDYSRNATSNAQTAGTLTNANTGDEFASFLLGSVDFAQISTTNFISSTKKAYAFYAQDDWKLSPKLTVNVGLRYELFSPIGEKFSRQSNFVLQDLTLYIPSGPNQNDPLPLNFATLYPNVKVNRGNVNQYLIPWDKVDFGPRIGFAYNMHPKTVVRGAYGIFYGGEENQGGYPNRGEAAPFNETAQLGRTAGVNQFLPDNSFAGGVATQGLVAGFPTNVFTGFPVSSLSFRSLATDFRNPMVQKWNIAVQQEMRGHIALEVSYVGNHSSHQLLQPDFNSCPNLATTNSNINCNSLRPYPNIGGTSGTATWGWGYYHGLTAKLEKRLSDGLQFVSSYTYGHAYANSGTTLSGSNGYYIKDPWNWNTSEASAAWDIRHNFTTGFNYDIPFGKGLRYGGNMNRAMNTITGNWHVNGILTLHTGNPYTLRSNGCTQGVWADNNGSNGGCSPDAVAGKNPDAAPSGGRTPNEWFNVANVIAPVNPNSEGTLALQTNYAPPLRTLDFSLFKDFAITERWKLQFRAEGTNIANTPQFGTPDNNQQDCVAILSNGSCKGNFGKVTSSQAGTERHLQFALRLQF